MTRGSCRRGRERRRKGTALLGLLLVAAAATSIAAVSRHGPTATSTDIRSRSSSSCFLLPHGCQRPPRRVVEAPTSAHRSGGGGSGKGSKEKRRERGRGSGSSSSSQFSPRTQSFSSSFAPPTNSDEMPVLYDKDGVETMGAMEGTKPLQWPNKVLFSQKLKWAPSSAGQDIKESFRRRLLPGIEVRYITEPSHVLKGQYGVYATREFAPFDVIGEYVGRVVPPKVCGEYVATIDWEDCRLSDGAGHLWGVDSAVYGNEVRMINHYHRISPVPNVKFVTSYIAELPHILVVVVRPIARGAEVLIDYGPNYWCGKYHAPPADPPGIDDPPEERVMEVEEE
ncbi:hypothetical protein VYU27_009242 [Nannochloropsis oceanica]